ncbi:MAG: hypothetical protein ACR2NG_07945 [Acidimicrobiia bacterium]
MTDSAEWAPISLTVTNVGPDSITGRFSSTHFPDGTPLEQRAIDDRGLTLIKNPMSLRLGDSCLYGDGSIEDDIGAFWLTWCRIEVIWV